MDKAGFNEEPIIGSSARREQLSHPTPVAEIIPATDCTMKSFNHGQSVSREQQLHHPIPVAGSDSGSDCTIKSLNPSQTERDDSLASSLQLKPGTPILLGRTEDSLSIGWEVQDISGIFTFSIRYSEVDVTGKTGQWIYSQATETTDNRFTLQNLIPNTPYRIRVKGEDEDGTLFQGITSDIFTTAEVSPPPAPTSIRLVENPKPDSIRITWDQEDRANVVCRYTVSVNKSGTKLKPIVLETEKTAKPVTIKSLTPNTEYTVTIVAHSNHGSSVPGRTQQPILTSSPLPPPGIPNLVNSGSLKSTHDSLTLKWDVPRNEITNTTLYFCVQYKNVTQDGEWEEHFTSSNNTEATICNLESEKSYVARVIQHSSTIASEPSQIGGPFMTTACKAEEQSFKQNIVINSKHVHSDQELMPLYQLPLKKVKGDARIERKKFGEPNLACAPEEKVILIVGATGAGKSTFINAMVNFLLGTDWSDDFRFRLVEENGHFDSQHKSQTKLVTVYKLHHQANFKVPYTLTIIDTPGFGDTDGIERDKEITEAINSMFRNTKFGVDHIDAVGFVVQSSLARLTASQRYIFDSILSLFGKDIASNIFLLITFCDPEKPPVLASITEAQVPFNASFKFNNSALFASNVQKTEENGLAQVYWDMGVKAFQRFLSALENVEGKSLLLTKAVLGERKQIEVSVTGLHEDVRTGLSTLEELQNEYQVVRRHEADIKKNKDFTYNVVVRKERPIKLETGTHVTNCLICNRTCHYPCKIKDDKHKNNCIAMDRFGNCKVCQGKCSWDLHKHVPYRIVQEEVQENRTLEDLKQRYDIACGKKNNAQILFDKILEEFYQCQVKVLCLTEDLKKGIIRLSEIALKPNPLSVADYIDILIYSEMKEAKPGWQSRVEQLSEVKKQAITIQEVAENGGYNPFSQYASLLEEAKSTKNGTFKTIAQELKKKCEKTFGNIKKFFKIT